ncbi:AAC(3) family N-acetyltransferase [Microbaculum marinum]|uniref:Aminoglycoside N(3)-acetyltransferase n=1 Tax=Microbaculum marinum TaxID=1764581 RepID=A0AAW9RKQ3_9HYPH
MNRLVELRRRASRTYRRYRNPLRPDEFRRALDELGLRQSDILFVHSSLSAMGRFTAGLEDIVDALGDVCGTLGLPTHTYSYPEASGAPAAVFDPATTPSRNGLFTEYFRRRPEAVRSVHSTHSLAMQGPEAGEMTMDHYQSDTPCGAGTPYARMIEARASALLLGVSFHSYTFFHTAEDAADSPFAYEDGILDILRVLDEAGEVRQCVSRRQTRNARRFASCGDLIERAGLARRGALGAGTITFVPDCAKVHDFLVERLRVTPDFLYAECAAPLN